MTNIAELFKQYIHLIRIKKQHEEKQLESAQAFMRWYDGSDTKTFEHMAAEGARLEDELRAAANVQIAFADKGPDQQRWIDAADYSDEFEPGMRAWYICRSKLGASWG